MRPAICDTTLVLFCDAIVLDHRNATDRRVAIGGGHVRRFLLGRDEIPAEDQPCPVAGCAGTIRVRPQDRPAKPAKSKKRR